MTRRLKTLLACLGLGLSGCMAGSLPYDRPQPRSQAEIEYVLSVLDELQAASFADGREYCGYVLLSPLGHFDKTERRKGHEGSCRPKSPPNDYDILASFHTHGAYSVEYESEYPSRDDVLADMSEGNDGYVSTPGGRVWYVDGATGLSSLLCDRGCVRADPKFVTDGIAPEMGRDYAMDDLDDLTAL